MKNLVFIHPFKCAGTSIRNPLHHRLQTTKSFYSWHLNAEHKDYIDQRDRDGITFFSGHLRDKKTFDYVHSIVTKPYYLMTTLRDPVDRVLSTYFYVRDPKCHAHPLHVFMRDNPLDVVLDGPSNRLLRECWTNLFYDYQVRLFSGVPMYFKGADLVGKSPELSGAHLKHAIANLHYFSYIGLQHEISTCWPILKKKFGVPGQHKRFVGKKCNPSAREPVGSGLRDKIWGMNHHDSLLWDWAHTHSRTNINLGEVEIHEDSDRPTSF